MKSTKLGIALLALLAFVVTTGTFAYWAAGVTGPADDNTTGTVTIGTGETVTTSYTFTSTTDSDSLLVPSGYEDGSSTFATLPLSYEMQWEDNGEGSLTGTTTTGDLTVTYTVVVIDEDGTTDVTAAVGSLINVTPVETYPTSITLNAAAATYSFNITMDEPADTTEYNQLSNSEIQITFTWSIANVSTS